jgi:hypothetical protein
MKPIWIKPIGEAFEGRSPYRIFEEDDWLTILYDSRDNGRPTEHELNIWLDDQTNQWKWAIYYPRSEWNAFKDANLAIASGDAEPALDYEGH